MKLVKVAWFIFPVLFWGCGNELKRENVTPESFRQLTDPSLQRLESDSPYLKAHMMDGTLYAFESWKSDPLKSSISGKGSFYDASRTRLGASTYTVGLDSIALLETNVLLPSGASAAIMVYTGITAAVSIYCATNPKACFGSCPTFYAYDGVKMRLQAEGFSSSITPSLEATDTDALYFARPSDGELNVEMRNEALETHVVRHVDALMFPRADGKRIFRDEGGKFWKSGRILAPVSAKGPEGICLAQLSAPDGIERISLADEKYLAEKETLALAFEASPGRRYGLLVGVRQSLLTTYLLYQIYAYMGRDVGHWLAEMERQHLEKETSAMAEIMGGIEVLIAGPGGEWEVAGKIDEHGPLATDVHVVRLPELSSESEVVNVKLKMSKGLWRIDHVALVELVETVEPIRLHPEKVMRDSQEVEYARQLLLDSTKALVTLPGDTYVLTYKLPERGQDYEIFLESRGYYLEWIRKEWMAEENLMMLAELMYAPENALRRMAPEFKKVESSLEDSFWRSRYARP